MGVLPKTLLENNVNLEQLVVYTVEKRHQFDKDLSLLEIDAFQAVVFFSPSGVEFTGEILRSKLSEGCVLVAFGKSTAAALSLSLGDKFVIKICEHPTPLGVLDVLMSL